MITTDPVDHRPVRAERTGSELLPGLLAWRRLGIGHRLETWLTWSTAHWAPVVVKLPRPDQLDHPRARAALAREANALAGPGHPGLPRLLLAAVASDPPHVVLEWLDGPALDDVLAESEPPPAGEALALAAQLAASLRWLHVRRLAHLDLTPANVVLRDGWPVLLDLGAARPFGTPTDPGEVGTLGYTAPELERGDPVSPAMDLYGLGALLRDVIDGPDHPDHPSHPLAPAVDVLLRPDPDERPRDVDAVLDLIQSVSTPATGSPWPPFAERHRTTPNDPRRPAGAGEPRD